MEIFRLAWMPISLDVMHAPEGPDVFRAISRFYVGVGMAGIIVLTALSPKLLQWFTVPAFYPAYPIVGVLAFSAIFFWFLSDFFGRGMEGRKNLVGNGSVNGSRGSQYYL